MNWTKKIHLKALTILSAGLLTVSSWGAAAPVHAAAAPAGAGDHGLLKQLQAKYLAAEDTPLSFNDLAFLSADTGRAVGKGFMIGTSDGGSHFQKIYEGQWNFRQISFPDNVHGWALASVQEQNGAYLIGTSDGGSTWKRISESQVGFERIAFTDSKHGFGYVRAFAYYTEDGGRSWSQIKTPAHTRGAEFTSRNNGWAVVVAPGEGYRVMKTTDGGSTWKLALKSPFAYPEYGQVYAKGDQVYALLYGGSGMSQTSYSLYASGNQGKSWTRVIAQETAGGGPAPGSGSALLKKGPASGRPANMQLAGSSTAFLAGYSPAGEQVAVGRTVNAGKQWSNLPAIAGYEARISFPDSKAGWMAVKGADTSSLYATKDGGMTWTEKFAFKGKSQ